MPWQVAGLEGEAEAERAGAVGATPAVVIEPMPVPGSPLPPFSVPVKAED